MTDYGDYRELASDMLKAAALLDRISQRYTYAYPDHARWSAHELRLEAELVTERDTHA